MNKKLIGILVIVGIGIGSGGFFVFSNIQKPFLLEKDTKIEIKDGDTLTGLLNRLSNEGILKNELVAKIYFKLNGDKVNLTKGVYAIKPDTSLKGLVQELSKTTGESATVTIPEGANVEKIADILSENGIIGKDEFIEAVKNYDLPDYIKENPDRRYQLEGFLCPETYSLTKDMSGKQIIDTMLNQFEVMIDDIEATNDIVIRDDYIDRLVIKASMIENEAASDVDRKKIASVINNRLKINMILQIDAAVTYGVGEHLEKVYNQHLEKDTPYNTYKRKGLPVGAIGNPGRKSIEAALDPDITDYKFYLVIPGTKEHYFTNDDKDFEAKRIEYGYNN